MLLAFGIDERYDIADTKKDGGISEMTDGELHQYIIDLFTGLDIEFVAELHKCLGERLAGESVQIGLSESKQIE